MDHHHHHNFSTTNEKQKKWDTPINPWKSYLNRECLHLTFQTLMFYFLFHYHIQAIFHFIEFK